MPVYRGLNQLGPPPRVPTNLLSRAQRARNVLIGKRKVVAKYSRRYDTPEKVAYYAEVDRRREFSRNLRACEGASRAQAKRTPSMPVLKLPELGDE